MARRYGDSVRSGWRNVVDCVVRLHRLGLLPADVVSAATACSVCSVWPCGCAEAVLVTTCSTTGSPIMLSAS